MLPILFRTCRETYRIALKHGLLKPIFKDTLAKMLKDCCQGLLKNESDT